MLMLAVVDDAKHRRKAGQQMSSVRAALRAKSLDFFPFERADPEVDWRARRVVEAQQRGESTMATIASFYPQKSLSLSGPLIELLDRMLLFDPHRRASLVEVAYSPWLAPHCPGLETTVELSQPGRVSWSSAAFLRFRCVGERSRCENFL